MFNREKEYSESWDEGFHAYYDNPNSQCWYLSDTLEYDDWMDGFCQAELNDKRPINK